MRVRKADAEKSEVSGSTDVFALGAASQLLQQIRSEHLYSTPSDCSLDKYCCPEEGPSTSRDEPHSDISNLLDTLKAKTASQDSNFSNVDGELDMLSLNADSIQKQFQNMIDLTSFSQIPDLDVIRPSTARARKVNFIENLSESDDTKKNDSQTSSDKTTKPEADNKKEQTAPTKDKPEQKPSKDSIENAKILRSSKTSDKSKIKRSKARRTLPESKNKTPEKAECKPVNQDEWKSINKALEAERTLNLYLKYTTELLVRRWGEYLALTSEQIRQFEIENAKETGMIEEVIEMLEDKDRYVWQLIDELHFW